MSNSSGAHLSPFGNALAGALGGVFSNAVVYPLDTVKTRIQVADDKSKSRYPTPSVYKLLIRIWRKEGLGGYYKGFGASMLNTFSTQYAYFFFYSWVRNAYLKRRSRSSGVQATASIPTATELLLGAIAGALAQIFTIPVAVIATRQQLCEDVAPKADHHGHKQGTQARDNSFWEVGKEIIREDGVTGLWTGLRPGLVLTVNPAITYGVFERLKSAVAAPGERLSPWMAFMLGATSKTLATVVTYPYIMAKVRLQARPAASDDAQAAATDAHFVAGSSFINVEVQDTPATLKPRYAGALDLLSKVYREHGIQGWYQGMAAQITKAVLSQALLFMMKDQFEQYAFVLMLLWRKLSSSRLASPVK